MVDVSQKEGLPDILGRLKCAAGSAVGAEMYALIEDLYPLCRSITGDGVRQTLQTVQSIIPIEITEVPSGTKVFDWAVPKEWRIHDAYIASGDQRIVDFRESNLHVVSYSCPVDGTFTLDELLPHLHSLPEHPDWIPYRTSYYNDDWGFCLPHSQLTKLENKTYRVVIDAELFDGSLSYGEYCIKGESDDEILFFTHCCHPSLCNDNLSGIVVLTFLARYLARCNLRHTVRFVFAPATIGSITWLARNEDKVPLIKAGLVASVLGDEGHFRYKKSRRADAVIDHICATVLKDNGYKHDLLEFSPWGYDERQFCSPGMNLPIGRLTRSPNGEYPEYHTSADDLDLVHPAALQEALHLYAEVVLALEWNATYINRQPQCEPQLGRRGLYRKMGGYQDIEETKLAMLWMLNQSDGTMSVLDIAERSGMPLRTLHEAAELLLEHDLLCVPGSTTA